MDPYTEFARQIQNSIRWSKLMLAQSQLSLLTMRLMLREGHHLQAAARTALAPPQRRGGGKRKKRRH